MSQDIYKVTALAHPSAAIELKSISHFYDHALPASMLWLQAADDGWMLVERDGATVFRSSGVAGRRRCLQRARELGVLAVLS